MSDESTVPVYLKDRNYVESVYDRQLRQNPLAVTVSPADHKTFGSKATGGGDNSNYCILIRPATVIVCYGGV